MVETDTSADYIFRLVEQIIIEDIQNQVSGYFGLQVIGNESQVLPKYLTVSTLTQLYGGNAH